MKITKKQFTDKFGGVGSKIIASFIIELLLIGILSAIISCSNPAGGSSQTDDDSPNDDSSQNKVASPIFTPAEGSFQEPVVVTISCSTADAVIRFTLDGSVPTRIAGSLYSTPVTVEHATTLRAIAYKEGWQDSEITTGTFVIPLHITGGKLGAGCDSSYAITPEGALWAWGDNYEGRLGDGTTTDRKTPIQIASIGNEALQVSGGEYHTLLLKKNGFISSWGRNSSGQLGDGTTTKTYNPVPVSGIDQVTMVSGGQNHSIALKSDGTVWAWGLNGSGQLGDGSMTTRLVPVQVSGLSNAVSVATGVAAIHTFAVRADGTLWAWGNNSSGKLGDGTTTNRTTPVQVGLSNIKQAAAASFSSAALKHDGTVYTWGWNADGQLGNGTTTASNTPIQVPGLTNVTAIGAGATFVASLKSDGTIWTWGNNYFGQLGDGTKITRLSPVQVYGITDAVAIAVGEMHVIALKSDGTVWAWGSNTGGALGNGSGIDSSLPVQVQ
jgi:alpha-tubulin suppressor-like RCC1 family protein